MSQFTQDLCIAGYGDAYAATAETPPPESPTTDDDADEPTQAYSPGYVEAEVARRRAVRPDFKRLQLDPVLSKSPAVRLLIYPNVPGLDVSPYRGVTCDHEWVEVEVDGQTEGAEPVRVLAVAPSADQIACAITHDTAHFRLYFDPTQDRLVLNNVGHCVLVAAQLGAEDAIAIEPHAAAAVCPGFWALTGDDGPLLECRILPRTAWSIAVRLSTKRRAGTLPEGPEKRTKLSGSRRAAVPAQALRPASAGNALVDLGQDETIHVVGSTGGGYRLTRLATIADRQKHSSVWQASHSGMPGRLLVVKVVKAAGTGANDTVRAAESWAREATIHSSLNHPTILRFLGSDARFHSLYLEHVDAKSLQHFRRQGNDHFSGSDSDAQRIARDIASALDYVHKKGISHGDLKPANILCSHTRAVLIDFGLSFRNGQPPKNGGSPWYLAHEYMRDWRLRGPETDVWAFGVVMLWMKGGIPLPETTATWWIADIHPSGAKPSAVASAIKTMMAWLSRVDNARAALRQDEVLGGVIRDALEPEMKKRVNAATLKQRLSEIRL